jgi:hypothetical protein
VSARPLPQYVLVEVTGHPGHEVPVATIVKRRLEWATGRLAVPRVTFRTADLQDVVAAATNPDLDDNARRYTYVGVVEALEALS